MNFIWVISKLPGKNGSSASIAPGPCRAINPCVSCNKSNSTCPSNALICCRICFRSVSLVAPLMTMSMKSPTLVMTVSSIIPPFSFVNKLRQESPSPKPWISPTTNVSKNFTRSLPRTRTCPMWDTSKIEAFPGVRHHKCSFIIPDASALPPLYMMGKEYPAKETISPPND